MSQKGTKTVPDLVEKYKNNLPHAEKGILRRLILSENREIFYEHNGKVDKTRYRQLSRYLEKAFRPETKQSEANAHPSWGTATPSETERLTRHSMDFIPNLQRFKRTSTKDAWTNDAEWLKNQEYLEKHLQTGYPNIFEKLLTLRTLEDALWAFVHDRVGMKKEMLEKVREYSKGRGFLCLIDPKNGRMEFAYGPFDKPNSLRIRQYASQFIPTNPELSPSNLLPIARTPKKIEEEWYFLLALDPSEQWSWHTDADPTEEKKDLKNKMISIYKFFSSEMMDLMIKTKNGTPLLGECPACPPSARE